MEIAIASLAIVCGVLFRLVILLRIDLRWERKTRVMQRTQIIELEANLDLLKDRFEQFEHEKIAETIYSAEIERNTVDQFVYIADELNQLTHWVRGHGKAIRDGSKYVHDFEAMLFTELKSMQFHFTKNAGILPSIDERLAGILLYLRSRPEYVDWVNAQIMIKSSEPGFENTELGKLMSNQSEEDGQNG